MNRFIPAIVLSLAATSGSLLAQTAPPATPPDASATPQTTITVTSRAVLVDVIVTDRHGDPVTGLKQSDFSITEQGKAQTINYFQEHIATPAATPIAIPKLPPDFFTNVSPFPTPPAVNVLLLDSLNTTMDNQSYVHAQALRFLKTAKPGSRMAIFTMGLGLHFIQGFTDDPAVLVAALKNPKNNEVQTAEMLKSQEETNSQQNLIGAMSEQVGAGGGATATAASADMIAALENFIQENDTSQGTDRVLLTLNNLQRLATFLNGFPGRKNVIWFSQEVPSIFTSGGLTDINADPRMGQGIKKTLAMLASARVALYPVDAGGLEGNSLYQAGTKLPNVTQASQMIGPPAPADPGAPSTGGILSQNLSNEDQQRNANQENMKTLAKDSGGRAFINTNGLAEVIGKITSTSSDFYTLSYTPTDTKMDGTYRQIRVNLSADDSSGHTLSYRRGYYAIDTGLPGEAMEVRNQALQRFAAEHPGAMDPLMPFMDLGMPMSEQIPFDVRILPLPATFQPPAGAKNIPEKPHTWYGVDIAIDVSKLELQLNQDETRKGLIDLSLVVYDRYGNIISREEHRVGLDIKPNLWREILVRGLHLKAALAVPHGNYWLRIGVFDEASHLVGTLEVPFSAIKPEEAAKQ
ncbi:MAG: VWA domain-containing protein [Terracidiphilus sp.]